MRKSFIVMTLLAACGVGVAWNVSVARSAPREIVLVARDMAFYLEGDDSPNPTLRLRPGEEVRLTLVNRDRGMRHDLAIASLGIGTAVLPGDGSSQTIRLRAPAQAGIYDYLCRLHIQTMRGLLEVG
jgi:plastocyanin